MSLDYQIVGFDLDPETIELFDAILLNVLSDEELHDEFKKLKFIRKLNNTYKGKTGPIRQIVDILSKVEKDYNTIMQEHIRTETNMRRAIADMTEATRTIRTASQARYTDEKYEALKKLEGLEYRQNSYNWDNK